MRLTYKGAIMEQVIVQARVDKVLKEEVEEIYKSLGLDLPTAIRMFFTRTKMVKGIPFDTTLPEKIITKEEAKRAWEEMRLQARGNENMTLDEINEEIRLAREERNKGI